MNYLDMRREIEDSYREAIAAVRSEAVSPLPNWILQFAARTPAISWLSSPRTRGCSSWALGNTLAWSGY